MRGREIGRRAIEHPWVFREARRSSIAAIDLSPPTPEERIGLCIEHLAANCAARGERFGCHVTRRHLSGYLTASPGAGQVRRRLMECETYDECAAILNEARERIAA